MRTTTLRNWFGAAAIAVALTAAPAGASADTAMMWCTNWLSTYVDAGHGEDYFTSDAATYRDAQWSYAKVAINSSGTVVWEGELDASGCSPYVPVLPGTQYKFSQATKAQRSNRRIYVNPDSGDWGTSFVWLNSYYTTSSPLILNYHYTHTFSPNWESPKANLMPIAGRILNIYSTLEYPDSTYTYIRTDDDHCASSGGAYYIPGTPNVCVLGQGAGGWEDATTWKYIPAHEIGHRLADANDGPSGAGYNHSGAPSLCNCDHIEDYGSDAHCLGSREPSCPAQGEGFGHFFASAVFNSRVENDGKYVYPKEAWTLSGDLWIAMDPPTAWNAYITDSTLYYDRWMETYCDPGAANKGVELDWMRFFWEIWTTGDDKFSMDQISDVWEDTATCYWDDLLSTVSTQWGNPSNKRTLFISKGNQAGVDHYL